MNKEFFNDLSKDAENLVNFSVLISNFLEKKYKNEKAICEKFKVSKSKAKSWLSGMHKFDVDELVIIYEDKIIASIFNIGKDVFGKKFDIWLISDNFFLGDKPINLFSTQAGRNNIIDELTRISHGIFC